MVSLTSFLSQKAESIQFGIINTLRILLVILFLTSILYAKYFLIFASLVVLVLSFVPAFIQRNYRITLPVEFEFIFTIFLYAAFILGETSSFYQKIWWWDLLLHSISGFVIAMLGFMILYTFYYIHEVTFNPAFAAIFTFSFSLSIGALWEIFEFTMDGLFGLNMQKSGLVDTMADLIIDAIGALLASIMAYFYLLGGDSLIIDKLVKKFVVINQHRFEKADNFIKKYKLRELNFETITKQMKKNNKK